MSTPGLFEFLLNPDLKKGNQKAWHQEEIENLPTSDLVNEETYLSDDPDVVIPNINQDYGPIILQKSVDKPVQSTTYMSVYPGHRRVPRPSMLPKNQLSMPSFNKSVPQPQFIASSESYPVNDKHDPRVPSLFNPPVFDESFYCAKENINLDSYYRSIAFKSSRRTHISQQDNIIPSTISQTTTQYIIAIPDESDWKFDINVKSLAESISSYTRALKNGPDLLGIPELTSEESRLAKKWKKVIAEDNGRFGGQRSCEKPTGECKLCDDVLVDQIFYNRLISGYYSVKVCFDYEKYGKCKYGPKCRYYHCPAEMQSLILTNKPHNNTTI